MEGMNSPSSATAGTIGGTFLVLLLQLDAQAFAETAILACVGAAVSYGTSYLLKKAVRCLKARKEQADLNGTENI